MMFAKAPVPASSNSKPVLIKRFGHLVLLYPGEAEHLPKDVHALAKAVKHKAKQWKKIELECKSSTALKKAAFSYLNSLRCRQAAMLEVNKRLTISQRLSLHQIIEKSKEFQVLSKLDEAVQVSLKLKSSGAYRPICNFGPVARAAQRMVLKLLRATTTLAPFQFTRLGVHKAIEEALRLITEEGYHEIAEIDIKDHYPSFEVDSLVAALPQLPASAVKQIVAAASAKYEGPHKALSLLFSNHLFHQAPSGIPQGSAASAAIAEWSVSKLKMVKVKDIAIVNFADNFFVLAKNAADLTSAVEALRSAIAGLPGGAFKTEVKQETTAVSGFRMLGCWIRLAPDGVDVFPTETNLERLHSQFRLDLQSVEALLSTAKNEASAEMRRIGVQAYLKLRNYVLSWASAYSHCSEISVFEGDLLWQLDLVEYTFKIHVAELEAAIDPSVNVTYSPYGSSAGE